MFVKLTKLDGSPIWLNAGFIVTVEPRKGGGSVVVPVGDGLDYDVRETPEAVLALLDGAPAPQVVPVPSRDALTREPDDVSPDSTADELRAMESAGEAPSAGQPPAPAPVEEPEKPAEEPAKPRPAARRAAKPRTRAKKAAPALLDEAQVERLRRLAPGSVRKLANTLATQFNVACSDDAVKDLVDRGVIAVEQERVVWKA